MWEKTLKKNPGALKKLKTAPLSLVIKDEEACPSGEESLKLRPLTLKQETHLPLRGSCYWLSPPCWTWEISIPLTL